MLWNIMALNKDNDDKHFIVNNKLVFQCDDRRIRDYLIQNHMIGNILIHGVK